MTGSTVLHIIATLALWLAPFPAAFFVGRSVYWHLIHQWHLDLGWLGVGAAIVAGGMVEIVGILSAHVALACARWNTKGDVKKQVSPWQRAPFALAVGCFGAYIMTAILLSVVLEALPHLAVYAPALLTIMAAATYVSVGVYGQHQDRLRYYGLQWDWQPVQIRMPSDRDGGRDIERDDRNMDQIPKAQYPDDAELDSLDRAIMRTFRTEPDASYRIVAQAVGSAKTTVGGRVNRLVQSGLMVRTAEGWSVQWSDNGRQEHD